jgi:uncharacterized protein (DUF1697 family)
MGLRTMRRGIMCPSGYLSQLRPKESILSNKFPPEKKQKLRCFNYEPVNIQELAAKIEHSINQTFGFPVTIIIRTPDELEKIINHNPLLPDPNIAPDKLHVTLLLDQPDLKLLSGLDFKKDENERFTISGREVYLYCPNGYGNTKLTNNIFEKKLNTKATTRNWKTMNKLLELGKGV